MATAAHSQSLIDTLREVAGISDRDLEHALEVHRSTHEPLPEVLVNMGVLTAEQRAQCLARHWGVPFVHIKVTDIPPEAVRLIPPDLLQRLRVVPLGQSGKRLSVAMSNPLDIFAIDQLRLVTGFDIEPAMATEDDLNQAIPALLFGGGEEITKTLKQVTDQMDVGDQDFLVNTSTDDETDLDALREMMDQAPVIKLVNLIVQQAIQDSASDIHLQPEEKQLRVRMRVDGILHDKMTVPKQVQSALLSRVKLMADMDISEKRAPQDGRISLRFRGREYDFRVSSYPGSNGEKIVLRVLDKRGLNRGLHQVGITGALLEEFERLYHRPHGIVLVTGPTGSGKTTTLYSVLRQINSPEKNILTIEDPVEYQLAGLTQGQVNPRAQVTFASALRTMLRQDPNIILVGEMRDQETAKIAIEAALTGHLVFSTLHTNDAPTAATRLMEMGVEPFLVASTLAGVLAQRLVRVICTECKEEYEPPREAYERLGIAVGGDNVRFYRGKGCKNCGQTGYKGRIGVFELMVVTDTIRQLILGRAGAHELSEAARLEGMVPLRGDAMHKVLEGVTTMEEALRVIHTGD